ncbi:MAG: hypothetical protein E4H15_06075, partial [Syntrophobacterales bacterium]
GNYSTLYDIDENSFFGLCLDIGDIDGDGEFDMIVGAPGKTNPEGGPSNGGAVYTYFNISRFKEGEYFGHPLQSTRGECYERFDNRTHSGIWGSGDYDAFGKNLELIDLNNDGKDEIVVASPYADGPADIETNAGQIHIFNGNLERGYPAEMDAESDSDHIIMGDQGYVPGDTDTFPDTLGSMFRFSDLNNDGQLEMVIGLPNKLQPELDYGWRVQAGAVCVFELKDLIRSDIRMVRLGYPSKLLTIQGHDIEDALGYHLDIFDVDTDGIDDLLIGAPAADGNDNERPRCGEIYWIRGKGLGLKDITVSGESARKNEIFLGDGTVFLNISYRNTEGSESIREGTLIIDPDGIAIPVEITRNGAEVPQEFRDMIGPNGIKVKWYDKDEKGWVNLSFEPGWQHPGKGPIDIRLEMISEENISIHRTYKAHLNLKRDIKLDGNCIRYVDNTKVLHPDRWYTPGEMLEFRELRIVYRDDPKREVETGPFKVMLMSLEGNVIDSKTNGPENSLAMTVPSQTCDRIIRIETVSDINGGWPFGRPQIGEALIQTVKVDSQAPDNPSELRIASVDGIDGFSNDGNFLIEWENALGKESDHDGSGTKRYKVDWEEGSNIPMNEGGLHGTYYKDPIFTEVAMESVDQNIDFLDWGAWGPEPSLIPPTGYSVRWHGWYEPTHDHDRYIKFSGNGEVKTFLDDNMILDWNNMFGGTVIGPLDMVEGQKHSLEIYYRSLSGSSGISMSFMDDQGAYKVVPGEKLFAPSNFTVIHLEEDGTEIKVTSMDWTGKYSIEESISGIIDDTMPVIDIERIAEWYNVPGPELTIGIFDPYEGTGTGSGVDIDSFQFREREAGEKWSDWKTGPCHHTLIEGSGSNSQRYDVTVMTSLNKDGVHDVQFRASDRLGNLRETGPIRIGIDRGTPE